MASLIRFESLGLIHGPYTLPAGNPIGPSPSVKVFFKGFLHTKPFGFVHEDLRLKNKMCIVCVLKCTSICLLLCISLHVGSKAHKKSKIAEIALCRVLGRSSSLYLNTSIGYRGNGEAYTTPTRTLFVRLTLFVYDPFVYPSDV